MNKKWAEDYSSEEGSGDECSDEDIAPIVSVSVPEVTNSDAQNLIVQVSDISFSACRTDIGKFFEEEGCKILRLDLLESNGRSRGVAIIEFSNALSLEICMGLNNKTFFGRNIKIVPFSVSLNKRLPLKKLDHHDVKRNEKGGHLKYKQVEVQKRSQSDNRGISSQPTTGSPPVKHVESVPERPKLNLKPRTLPINSMNGTVFKQNIFGSGKPHDDAAYEV
jgi:hypothetical protein